MRHGLDFDRMDGTVAAAGYNKYGQCNVEDWTDIVSISAGDNHTVGLKADGTVVAVGYNLDGQCDVSNWKNIVAVAAGGYHTLGLRADGTVVYDIFSGKSRPGRDHAVMLALGLKANLRETQRILRLAGVAELWCKHRRDAVHIWCIEHGLTRAETDDELYRLGEKTLLGTDRLQ